MLARLFGIREEDIRATTVAVLTLFGTMAAHAVLETARDALFLSSLPSALLPWAYVAIALTSLVTLGLSRLLRTALARKVALSILLFAGAAITLGFYTQVERGGANALLLFYVWTGLLASTLTVEFWLLVARVLNIGQAKRVFSIIGGGGLAGATVGAALAGGLLEILPSRELLLVASGILAITALAPLGFGQSRPAAAAASGAAPKSLALLRSEPYLVRLLAVVLAASVLLTGVDFLFKATAATDLAPDQLGPFFARFYALTSFLALGVQLFVAPRALRVLGVNTSLVLLPSLLVLGSIGFVVASGLGAAIVLRGADATLRHSVHRTGIEILHVPLPAAMRDRFKGFVETFGQRGGQAMASVLLLAALSLGATTTEIGLGVAGLAVVWLVAALAIRPHYVELFRRNLRAGFLETHADVPDLDLHSLEALIGALSADNDHEVLAALDLLESYGKSNLVPALILYHPSPDVVLRAFALFSGSGRTDVDRLTGRLLSHDDDRIRTAALRYSARRADTALLESMAEDPAANVRTTALVELIRRGAIDEWRGGDLLRGIIDGDSAELRRALVTAARDLPRGRYAWALIRLAFVDEPGLAAEAARSMAASPDVEYVPTLVRLLSDRDCRDHAREAIVALGGRALGPLDRALSDPTLGGNVRRHLPRTLARFGAEEATEVLMRRLPLEQDERVETAILRALERVRSANPTVPVDRAALLAEGQSRLGRATLLAYWRALLDRCVAEGMASRSRVAEMLAALLVDKETSAIERTFRILSVVSPEERFDTLFFALKSTDAAVRESARELSGHVIPEPLRSGVLSLLGEGSAEARVFAMPKWAEPEGSVRFERVTTRLAMEPQKRPEALRELRTLQSECFAAMLLYPSDALRGVASFRIAELGLPELGNELKTSAFSPDGALAGLSEEAMELLGRSVEVSRAG